MVTDAFGLLLEELSPLLHIKNLHPDDNHVCLIKFPNKVSIQLEPARSGNGLFIICNFGSIPPGRYREDIFREALKSNGMTPPLVAEFSYSKKADSLVLSKQLPIKDLNGEKIMTALTPFLEKTSLWHEAILRGEIPSTLTTSGKSSGSGMFGLR